MRARGVGDRIRNETRRVYYESIPSHGRLESTGHDGRVLGARHDVDAGVAAGHVDRCVIHVVRQPSVRARRGGGESGAAALPEALGADLARQR